MSSKLALLLAALSVVGCGGGEGEENGMGPAGGASASLGAISAVPYWTEIWATDMGSSPFGTRSRCVFGPVENPMLVGGFAMDLDRHFGGQTGPLRRVCDIDAGQELLVPLVTVTMDGAALDHPPAERVLAARVSRFVDGVKGLTVYLDGEDTRSLGIDLVRTFPESYAYMLPPAGALYELPGGQLEVPMAVADGIFMVLPKLGAGRHLLVIEGIAGGRAFRMEYELNAD